MNPQKQKKMIREEVNLFRHKFLFDLSEVDNMDMLTVGSVLYCLSTKRKSSCDISSDL